MRKLAILLVILSSCLSIFSQSDDDIRRRDRENQRKNQIGNEQETIDRILGNGVRGRGQPPIGPVDKDDPRLKKNDSFAKFSMEDREKVKALGTPSPQDINSNKDFLSQKNSGIFKLIDPSNCGNSSIVNLTASDCFWRIPNLSYFSFRSASSDNKIKYSFHYEVGSADIKYEGKGFFVGFEDLNIGMIGEISNVEINDLKPTDSIISKLKRFQLPKKQSEILGMKEKIQNGIDLEDVKFSNQVDLKMNQTYLLRSYSYRTNTGYSGQMKNQIDVIVAFRILSLDKDRDITVIWKYLTKTDTRQV